MSSDLNGQVVIVTGASSGIGEATARLLHAAGAHPVLAARRGDRLRLLSEELEGALAVPTDVTEPEQVQALVKATVNRFGRVDGLVNNAGAGAFHRLDAIDPTEFLAMLNLNVVAPVTAIQAVLPHMRAAGRGRVVNVSSGATLHPMPGNAIYPAAKTALNWLSEVGRTELDEENIHISLVLPFVTDTEFYKRDDLPTVLQAHSPLYVGRVILRALRTGEDRIVIPRGPEQPDFPDPQ